MTGNIIVSTCCLGDMAVNAPESEGIYSSSPRTRGRLQPYHPRKHVLTITYCMAMDQSDCLILCKCIIIIIIHCVWYCNVLQCFVAINF